jgi:Fic family protein
MRFQLNERQRVIFEILNRAGEAGTAELLEELLSKRIKVSRPTLNRDIEELTTANLLIKSGSGPSTVYKLSNQAKLLTYIDSKEYFRLEADQRNANKDFNWQIFQLVGSTDIFDDEEAQFLHKLDAEFRMQRSNLSETIIQKEIERVTIELSWKSSAIEGNTYSLLETENLLKNGLPAKGRSKAETQMILNHKVAIKYIFENPEEYTVLDNAKIEKIHAILAKDLGIKSGIRTTLVGITGTVYQPLDNSVQIHDALSEMCKLINNTQNFFAKSMMAMLLTSYIQAFEDGNKRTSRLIGNAVLIAAGSFPLSLRSVDEVRYKEALLLFYEQNNLSMFKEIYLEQSEFSVKNYFRSTKA